MKFSFLFLILCGFSLSLQAQMNNALLEEQLTQQVDSIAGQNGRWQLLYNEVPMMVLTDATADRMRIIAPIVEASSLSEDILLDCMTANFHSALDVKYSISNDILWSTYIHPLSPLTNEQLTSALSQVYSAVATFGTTYSSTELLFGGSAGQTPNEAEPAKPELKLKKT